LQSVKCVSTTTLGEDRPTGRLQQTDMSQPHDDLGRLDTRVFLRVAFLSNSREHLKGKGSAPKPYDHPSDEALHR
jgi:hypothetical protein